MNKSLLLIIAALAACAALMVSCSDDDKDTDLLAPLTFEGKITSLVTPFPDYSSTSDDKAVVTWTDATRTTCTIDLGGFDVNVDQPQYTATIPMGDMKITGVKCTAASDGSYTFEAASFDCMSGKYEIKGGSLTGTLKADKLEITLSYKPGSMPFPVVSTFVGDKK